MSAELFSEAFTDDFLKDFKQLRDEQSLDFEEQGANQEPNQERPQLTEAEFDLTVEEFQESLNHKLQVLLD